MADEYFGGPSDNATTLRLRRLQTKGRIVRTLRGVYAAVPPGASPITFQPDPFLILATHRPDCIFCGHSALELNGVGNQLWNRISAYSHGKATTFRTQYATFSLFKSPAWVTPETIARVDRAGKFLFTTGPELTLVEGFRYPNRVGGIEELVKSASDLRSIDLKRLRKVLELLGMRKLYGAVGWFLETHASNWRVDSLFLDDLRIHRPASPRYLEPKMEDAVMDPNWNLMVQRDIVSQGTNGNAI